ncbi:MULTISPECIES: hypothetical protein [unclassified Nonomuraea]|uniref:hypothetical protein n=1 Tax=unclassified Nonomuraea TaxID=2593643 RepID=UPI001F18DA0D|nr:MULTISPECIES: hypothetical protein [unclassified Nonomuraea]
MAAVRAGAMPRRQILGSARIGVGDPGDRHVGESGQNVCMASGDISGAYDADAGHWGHNPAYATSGGHQTNMFISACIGQLS